MCLTVKNNILTPQTAKKDILVWKVIYKKFRHVENVSICRLFRYIPHNTYHNKIFVVHNGGGIGTHLVYQGFHAFVNRKVARKKVRFCEYRDDGFFVSHRYKIVKFIIPKGAKYYIGVEGDIVADRIQSCDLKHCR